MANSEKEFSPFVRRACEVLFDKKAEDIKIIEVGKFIPQITNYFIIATANSTEHMNALKKHLEDELALMGARLHHSEGSRNSRWMLLDYDDFIIHIMLEEAREFYRLEELWGDAPRWTYEETFKRED
uniref:Ribosomal silencing factor RsfS n=1 Tax=candidate division WOR-3 bacterium TaxID=2052148 RepID=A0A7V3ZXE3_UNCW3